MIKTIEQELLLIGLNSDQALSKENWIISEAFFESNLNENSPLIVCKLVSTNGSICIRKWQLSSNYLASQDDFDLKLYPPNAGYRRVEIDFWQELPNISIDLNDNTILKDGIKQFFSNYENNIELRYVKKVECKADNDVDDAFEGLYFRIYAGVLDKSDKTIKELVILLYVDSEKKFQILAHGSSDENLEPLDMNNNKEINQIDDLQTGVHSTEIVNFGKKSSNIGEEAQLDSGSYEKKEKLYQLEKNSKSLIDYILSQRTIMIKNDILTEDFILFYICDNSSPVSDEELFYLTGYKISGGKVVLELKIANNIPYQRVIVDKDEQDFIWNAVLNNGIHVDEWQEILLIKDPKIYLSMMKEAIFSEEINHEKISKIEDVVELHVKIRLRSDLKCFDGFLIRCTIQGLNKYKSIETFNFELDMHPCLRIFHQLSPVKSSLSDDSENYKKKKLLSMTPTMIKNLFKEKYPASNLDFSMLKQQIETPPQKSEKMILQKFLEEDTKPADQSFGF